MRRFERVVWATFGAVVALAGAAAIRLAVAGSPPFEAGAPIRAQEVEKRFTDLETARPKYVNGSQTEYLDARYCGITSPVTGTLTGNDGTNGYLRARAFCASAAACGSPTAHMCTVEEIIRYTRTGGVLPASSAWISAGVYSERPSGRPISDCNGWKSGGNTDFGTHWTAGGHPGAGDCSTLVPVLCCD